MRYAVRVGRSRKTGHQRKNARTRSLLTERRAFATSACALTLACLPAFISVVREREADTTVRMLLVGGIAFAVVSAAVGLWARRQRLHGAVMLSDLRVGSTVNRGVSATGRTRNHLGVSPGAAFLVTSALALAMGGLMFVYLNLWDH